MSFPLYDRLAVDIPSKDLSVKQKTELIEKVNSIDQNGKELVYVLIQMYAKKNNINDLYPFKCDKTNETNGENLSWNLTDIPQKLRHILHKFISMHTYNMEEEEIRANVSLK
tara:strand:+ start:258 stop:593 length:336 start_codon:yes stop_codon:yes gene_type:complete